MAAPEPSPLFNTSTTQLLSATTNDTPRRRGKSSGLGQEICDGDPGLTLGTGLASTLSSDSPLTTSSHGHARRPSEQKKFSKRRKDRSLLRRCMHFALRKHTCTIPLVLILAFLSLYATNPTESNIIHHFIFLSYKQQPPEAGSDPSIPAHYGKGLWDIAFVAFYMIVLSFTREFIMQDLLRPLARFCGIRSRGKQARFMEQMYTAIYFGFMGPAGIYVMRRTPVWYFNTRGMYEFFPHRTHEAEFKFYYLFQAAYWAQQAIVMLLGLEKPRKDFKELITHHIVTLALIALSYRFHFMHMGIAVYLTHDISDFFLAVGKSLQYINSPAALPSFGLTLGMWIYLRNYLNLCIIFSVLTEFRTVGPYELNWETQQYKCWISNIITFSLLAALQFLNLFWLYCLLRSIYRYLVHRVVKDDRSDSGESEIEEEMKRKKEEMKIEPLPMLNGVIKVTGNGNAAPPTKRKDAL